MTEIISLFEKYIAGHAAADEQAALVEWIGSSRVIDALLMNELQNAGSELPKELAEKMLAQIKTKAGIKARRRQRFSYYAFAVAAAIALIIGLVKLPQIRDYLNRGELMAEIAVETGQKAQIALPDGTKVWLNSGTHLSYPSNFNIKDRKIRLSGEAYFEVARDTDRTFELQLAGMSITVLGTSFNVEAYEDSDMIVATLVEGSIKATTPAGEYIQKPNEILSYDKSSGIVTLTKSADALLACDWRNNDLVMNNESLDSIVHRLEKLYHVNIEIADPNISSMRFTGSIPNGNSSLNTVLEFISVSANISYSYSGDSIILSR